MKLDVEIPKRPEMTFHLELTEEEASLITILIRCVDKNNNPETATLYNIAEHLHDYLSDERSFADAARRARPNGRLELGTGVKHNSSVVDNW